MRVSQEQVAAFHEKMAYPRGTAPQLIDVELVKQRYKFIEEELIEYLEACSEENVVKVADALADLLYVVLGTAVVHGIEVAPVFEEVHRSNMTKDRLDPVTKKGGKGPGYEPPRIAEILFTQRHLTEDR